MAWLSSDGIGQAFKEVPSNPQEILHPGGIQVPLGAHGMKSAQGNPRREDPEVHQQRHCDQHPPDSNCTLFILNYTDIIIFVNFFYNLAKKNIFYLYIAGKKQH